DVMRALFLAAILMLIHNPSILLHDPSFQLSFLATLGLIILASPIENRISFITERLGIRSLIASTLATQIFISPFILYIMGQISIIGIVVNIIVLPFIPITMLFISITGFLGFISYFLSQLTSFISYILLSYELFIVQYFARLPFASIEVPKFSIWIVVGFYVFYFAIFVKLPSIISQLIFSKKSSI
ncbi:MAG TPA: ComEC/Rec2 family competence protein, partial [Candidatus Paceibacterota bacterium]